MTGSPKPSLSSDTSASWERITLGGISHSCCFPNSSCSSLHVLWINSCRKGAFVSRNVGGMARGGTDNPACWGEAAIQLGGYTMNYSPAVSSLFRKFSVKTGAGSGACEICNQQHRRSLSFWLAGYSDHPSQGTGLCKSLSDLHDVWLQVAHKCVFFYSECLLKTWKSDLQKCQVPAALTDVGRSDALNTQRGTVPCPPWLGSWGFLLGALAVCSLSFAWPSPWGGDNDSPSLLGLQIEDRLSPWWALGCTGEVRWKKVHEEKIQVPMSESSTGKKQLPKMWIKGTAGFFFSFSSAWLFKLPWKICLFFSFITSYKFSILASTPQSP